MSKDNCRKENPPKARAPGKARAPVPKMAVKAVPKAQLQVPKIVKAVPKEAKDLKDVKRDEDFVAPKKPVYSSSAAAPKEGGVELHPFLVL